MDVGLATHRASSFTVVPDLDKLELRPISNHNRNELRIFLSNVGAETFLIAQ